MMPGRAGDLQSWCDVYFPYMYPYYMHIYVGMYSEVFLQTVHYIHLYNADNVVVGWWGVVSGIYISHSSETTIFNFSPFLGN